MSRTLLRSSQALQVLLRHIENIYLSQAALHKTNNLKPLVTNSPLCLQWPSRYTALDLTIDVMKNSTLSTNSLRFGRYELDLRSGDLRKHGIRIKLQDQPSQILSILLEHHGEMVSREELQRRLWPSDTFVDFDHSLNTAIMRLRQALGDSSDNPRFIETIPRRGYRFIAPGAVPEQCESEGEADARNRPEPKNALEAYPDRRRHPPRQRVLSILAAPAALPLDRAI